MQVETYRKEDVKNLINEANHIGIIPSKISGADAFCAGVGLYNMLYDLGKDVDFVYPGKFPEEAEGLIEHDQVTSNLNERELLVSVNYFGTNAEKVHYKTEGDVLTFKLGPIPKNFDLNKVKAEVTGMDFDMVFVLGSQNLENLGKTYEILRDELASDKIVNIDNTKRNSRFGVINIVDPEADNLSLIVFQNAGSWGLVPNTNAANALLRGMTYRKVDN